MSELKISDIQASPTTELRRLQFENKLIDHDDRTQNLLKCCSNHSFIDKRLISEISKILISFGTLTFSFVMLIIDEQREDRQIWFSLISSIVGYYLGKNSN